MAVEGIGQLDEAVQPQGGGGALVEEPALPKHSALYGFAGVNGGLHQPAPFVDMTLPPGHTSQQALLGFRTTLRSVVTLRYFFYAPNLIWFSVALAIWLCFPYEIDAFKGGFPPGPCARRLALNFAYAFAYYLYWYASLYHLGLSGRKFLPARPSPANMAHDLYYWSLGVLQFTAWECVMMRLWASGAAPFSTNAEVLSSPYLLALNALWVLLVPIWRDVHFYFAHRFIHIRCIYKYVHSLHHRDADPEPFSGLCMHPAEHMPYYSNALLPALVLNLSPLIFLWTFVHLVLAPGAGHSGWEDHWQADQYHYLHHHKFECNYGSPFSGFIDQYMGTFREKMGESLAYRGEWRDGKDSLLPANGGGAPVPREWSRKSHLGLQRDSHLVYTCFCALVLCTALWGMLLNTGARRVDAVGPVPVDGAVAFITAYGPFIFAFLLCKAVRDPMAWNWPFQHERVIGGFGFFFMAGWLSCILPIFYAVKWACALGGNAAP